MSDEYKHSGIKPGAEGFNLREMLARIPENEVGPAAVETKSLNTGVPKTVAAPVRDTVESRARQLPPPVPSLVAPDRPARLHDTRSHGRAEVADLQKHLIWRSGDVGGLWFLKPPMMAGGICAAAVAVAGFLAIFGPPTSPTQSVAPLSTGLEHPLDVKVAQTVKLVSDPTRTTRTDLAVATTTSERTSFATADTIANTFAPSSIERPRAAALAATASPTAPTQAVATLTPPAAADTEVDPSLLAGKDESEEKARSLFIQGEARLVDGDVIGARMFFKKAADAGDAKAAVAMGATYDPNLFSTLKVQGMRPDIQLAQKWYERAISLGSKDAHERLDALAAK